MADREIAGATGGAVRAVRLPKVEVRGQRRHSRRHRRDTARAVRGPERRLRSLQRLLDGARSVFSRREGPEKTYEYLMGLLPWAREEREDRDLLAQADWSPVVQLLMRIRRSGERHPFESGVSGPTGDNGIGDWLGVHWGMAALIAHWFREGDALAVRLHARHGDEAFGIMRYLLEFSHREFPVRGDDYVRTNAETTRETLFRAFMGLARVECRTPEGRAAGIPPHLKGFGEAILKGEMPCREMTWYGGRVSDLYALDAAWVREMVPRFFPSSAAKGRRFVAAWESFLSVDFHPGMFSDPVFRRLYRRGLGLTVEDAYNPVLRDPEDGIGRHLAMAYLYVEDFGFDDTLFRHFRKRRSRTQHDGFVDLVGELIWAPRPRLPGFAGKRVLEFWEWMLDDDDADPDVLAGFGRWAFLPRGLFEPAHLARLLRRTLEKTAGRLGDSRGLRLAVGEFAEVAPHDTIAILERFFSRERMWEYPHRESLYLTYRDPWDAAIERLRKTPETAERARALGGFLHLAVSRDRRRQQRRAAELAEAGVS